MNWKWSTYTAQMKEWQRWRNCEITDSQYRFACIAIRVMNENHELFGKLART